MSREKGGGRVPFPSHRVLFLSVRTLIRIRPRDGHKNVKNNNRFSRQNNNFALAAHFFVHFFTVFYDYDVKLPNFTFSGGRKQATTKFYSLSILEYGS